MPVTIDGTNGITNGGGYTGDGVSFADATPANTLVTTTGGNVGIGTSSPSAKSHVLAGDQPTVYTGPSSGTWASKIGMTTNATANHGLSVWAAWGLDTSTVFEAASGWNGSVTGYYPLYSVLGGGTHIWRGNTGGNPERMRIDSAGNVGIGTSAVSGALDVRGNVYVSTTASGSAPANGGRFGIQSGGLFVSSTGATPLTLATNNTDRLIIDGTNGTLTSQPTYDNTATGSTVVVTSTGQIRRTSSSIKYKKDVESLDPTLATNAINNLRPVWYRTKNAEGDDKATWSHIGLIAEEVHEVEPRLVRYRTAEVVTDEEGNRTEVELAVPEPEDVDYARLSVLLLAKVKELEARLAAVEGAIA